MSLKRRFPKLQLSVTAIPHRSKNRWKENRAGGQLAWAGVITQERPFNPMRPVKSKNYSQSIIAIYFNKLS
jgi:hypothetical protein